MGTVGAVMERESCSVRQQSRQGRWRGSNLFPAQG